MSSNNTAELLVGKQIDAYCALNNFTTFQSAYRSGHKKYDQSNKVLSVAGYAGTGKSFLTSRFLMDFAKRFGTYTAVAFTGRAASNLTNMGGVCRTAHSLLYEPLLDDAGNLISFKPRNQKDIEESCGDIILVEEGSMMPEDIFKFIYSLNRPIIVIGDPEQLEPIEGKSVYSLIDDGTVPAQQIFLDEIVRQAEGSDIIRMATNLRTGGFFGRFAEMNQDQVGKTSIAAVNAKFFGSHDFDVVLCGTNKKRQSYNRMVRVARGFVEDYPQEGEIVVCLRNSVVGGTYIMNGERFVVNYSICDRKRNITTMSVTSMDEPSKSLSVSVDNDMWVTELASNRNKGDRTLQSFAFGYALSVHKAQGSTFKRVFFADENVSFFTNRQKFRYTAVTRASEYVMVGI